jgi:hypothetical protein
MSVGVVMIEMSAGDRDEVMDGESPGIVSGFAIVSGRLREGRWR